MTASTSLNQRIETCTNLVNHAQTRSGLPYRIHQPISTAVPLKIGGDCCLPSRTFQVAAAAADRTADVQAWPLAASKAPPAPQSMLLAQPVRRINGRIWQSPSSHRCKAEVSSTLPRLNRIHVWCALTARLCDHRCGCGVLASISCCRRFGQAALHQVCRCYRHSRTHPRCRSCWLCIRCAHWRCGCCRVFAACKLAVRQMPPAAAAAASLRLELLAALHQHVAEHAPPKQRVQRQQAL